MSTPPLSKGPAMPVRRLVIFDHDGLMVNTEDVVYAALVQLFEEHGCALSWDYYITSLGMPSIEAMKMFLRDLPLDMTLEQLAAERNKRVQELTETDLKTMPGLIPLLDALRARGDRMAVATSGRRAHIEHSLERFGLTGYFEAVVCIEDVKRGKPHPDLILEVLRRTGTAANNTIMLEDAPRGVEAVHYADVFCIAVPTHGIPLDAFALAPAIARDLLTVQRLLAE